MKCFCVKSDNDVFCLQVKEAHRLAQLGLAIVTVLDDPRKPVPQPTLQQLRPDLIKSPQTPRTRPKGE